MVEELEERECSYCDATEAADISVLLAAIGEVINAEYTDPVEELPYDGRDGGYQAEQLHGPDLVCQLDQWTEREALLDDAANAVSGSWYCRRDYFGVNEYEALRFGWETHSPNK